MVFSTREDSCFLCQAGSIELYESWDVALVRFSLPLVLNVLRMTPAPSSRTLSPKLHETMGAFTLPFQPRFIQHPQGKKDQRSQLTQKWNFSVEFCSDSSLIFVIAVNSKNYTITFREIKFKHSVCIFMIYMSFMAYQGFLYNQNVSSIYNI